MTADPATASTASAPATATSSAAVSPGAALDSVPDWRARAAVLADHLQAAGKLHSPLWRAAIVEVPRHVFVPRFYLADGGRMAAVGVEDPASREQWQTHVYANEALVTKLDADGADGDGRAPVFLSSSSTPGLMTRMLESLDVRDGHTVLEIGTGTGYNAGLLCHRLGPDNVVSIDVEPDLVDQARARLAGLGWHPTLLVGDGAAGAPARAPFDRVIATCSVPAVPWPWIAQTRIGGVILTDLRRGMVAGNLVRLTRVSGTRAEGMFDSGQASFMSLRRTPGPEAAVPYARAPHDTQATVSSTSVDPRTPWANPVVWFLAAINLISGYRLGYTGGGPAHGPSAVSISTPDGSRAEITIAPSADGSHQVLESGPTPIWSHVERAHGLWEQAGNPGWSRLGLRVTPDSQTVYLDQPDTILATLPATRG